MKRLAYKLNVAIHPNAPLQEVERILTEAAGQMALHIAEGRRCVGDGGAVSTTYVTVAWELAG